MKCTARTSGQKRPCKRDAIKGGTVCATHGGSAPQVKAKAQERLAALVVPAIDRLGTLMRQQKNLHVALGATNSVLDRNGIKTREELKIVHDYEGSWDDDEPPKEHAKA